MNYFRIKNLFFIILISNLFNLCLASYAHTLITPGQKEYLTENKFLGKWNMQTIVTKSDCPYVLVGSTTESNLEIKPQIKSNFKKSFLKALWKGGMWSKSTSVLKLLSGKEAITERITEFKAKDNNKWKAVLIDHLKLDDEDTMHSESIVIQYKNGLAVGEYKTISILTKSD